MSPRDSYIDPEHGRRCTCKDCFPAPDRKVITVSKTLYMECGHEAGQMISRLDSWNEHARKPRKQWPGNALVAPDNFVCHDCKELEIRAERGSKKAAAELAERMRDWSTLMLLRCRSSPL
jgi:hypothetical protein